MEKNKKEFNKNKMIDNKFNLMHNSSVIIYLNPDTNKKLIIKENKGKSGIYKWTNKITGRSYIGSSVNLGNRIKDYFNYSFLVSPKNKNMIIYKSLLKYGYSNFKLEIIEYCSLENTRIREQYFINLIKPEYNILKQTGSSLGYKHTKEALLKIRSHLNILNEKKGNKVEVTDVQTNITTIYLSIRIAALAIGANHKFLIYSDRIKKPIFGKYNIVIIRQ
jgi:hypothetical protein